MPKPRNPLPHYGASAGVMVTPVQFFPGSLVPPMEVSASRAQDGPTAGETRPRAMGSPGGLNSMVISQAGDNPTTITT